MVEDITAAPSGSGSESEGDGPERSRTPVSSLVVRLCLYNQRLFPVWPILSAEAVISRLLQGPTDTTTYALANAVCAAIIAQLKLPFEGRTDDNDPATAASMAGECERAKTELKQRDDGPDMNLDMLRISFFQHIYHENLSPGGSKSLLFLREAITIAQIMNLHRESSYTNLPIEQQRIRRRILWLLFVTERGVAMLHKLPTILSLQAGFPPLDGTANCDQEEALILPAFRRLVDLFRLLDQGGAFDLIHTDDSHDAQRNTRLEYLQRRLQEMSSEEYETNEVQKADFMVTRSWMQTMLWRASIQRPVAARASVSIPTASHGQASIIIQPYRIVSDFLSNISRYSKTALEAHGPTIELKIYEIASALTDALAANLDSLWSSAGIDVRPVDMLVQLQRLLASSRGGNKTLLTLLCARIAEMENGRAPEYSPNEAVVDADERDQTVSQMGGRRRSPRAVLAAYPDALGLACSLPLSLPLPVWPEAINFVREHPSQEEDGDSRPGINNDDACENLGLMFTQLANESAWSGWAIDLAGMSQVFL